MFGTSPNIWPTASTTTGPAPMAMRTASKSNFSKIARGYTSRYGGRAILAMEKGPPRDRAFAEALAVREKKWRRIRARLAYGSSSIGGGEMRTVIVAAAAMSGLINIASANQLVHLHCAPKTVEIRVFLNQSSVTRGNWRDSANFIGTGWSFVAKSRSGTNLIGDISSPRGDISAWERLGPG
jgi:hypothetical protein